MFGCWWQISSFKYTSESGKEVMKSQGELLEQKVSEDPSPEAQGCWWIHYEFDIQTPLRTQAVGICLFTLLYNWQQRWEQLASFACHIILTTGCGGTAEEGGFRQDWNTSQTPWQMALGELKWNWKVQGILEKVHLRWNEVTDSEIQNSERRQKRILCILPLTYGDAQWTEMIVNILAFPSWPQLNADLSRYTGTSPGTQPPLPCKVCIPKGQEISRHLF